MAQAITFMDRETQDKLRKVSERAKRRRNEGKKICNGCKKWVKLINFHVSKANRDGRVTLCKVCRSDRGRVKPVKTYNDKPLKCTQCRWIGIEADTNQGLCPDCQSRTRPVYFGTIQDSLRALKAIQTEMSPQRI